MGTAARVDSLVVDWPSGRRTVLSGLRPDSIITLNEKDATTTQPTPAISEKPLFTTTSGLNFIHQENEFNDFNRDPAYLLHALDRRTAGGGGET
ncbi:ASPIC/UnbV domain-containing protein [Puia sp. P3]|uniref:ASPIC/UnbV domain-containing protein n=1 Tax=Puia sp. P3 TaxID=3423952 RepID=UPI003D67460F